MTQEKPQIDHQLKLYFQENYLIKEIICVFSIKLTVFHHRSYTETW